MNAYIRMKFAVTEDAPAIKTYEEANVGRTAGSEDAGRRRCRWRCSRRCIADGWRSARAARADFGQGLHASGARARDARRSARAVRVALPSSRRAHRAGAGDSAGVGAELVRQGPTRSAPTGRLWRGPSGLRSWLLACLTITLAAQSPVARALPPWTRGTLDIHQISTGRGNAALIVFPDGTTMVVDAGAAGDGTGDRGDRSAAERVAHRWRVDRADMNRRSTPASRGSTTRSSRIFTSTISAGSPTSAIACRLGR